MNTTSEGRKPLYQQRIFWLWLPLVLVFLPYVVHALDPELYERRIRTEYGLVENLTAVFLAAAVVFGGLVSLGERGKRMPGIVRAFVGLLTLGCFYFLGEEISWGQHYFGWATPEVLAAMNEQGETNLHNIGGWSEASLDQGPRNLLTLGALVGGVLIPLRWSRAPKSSFWGWLWPTAYLVPSAFLAVTASLPQKIAKAFGEVPFLLDISGGESKELFLSLFLLIYLWTLWFRSDPRRGFEPAGA